MMLGEIIRYMILGEMFPPIMVLSVILTPFVIEVITTILKPDCTISRQDTMTPK